MKKIVRKCLGPVVAKLRSTPRRNRCLGFNTCSMDASWGGANQFALQMASHCAKRGYEISYDLEKKLSHVFILDVRKIETCSYTVRQLIALKKKNPELKVIHRINDCDIRKKYTKEEKKIGFDRVDEMVLEANAHVDFTVFISEWLRDYYIGKGFDRNRPHTVICNAADSDVFFPVEKKETPKEFKIITHHWSDNWMKGFHEYVELDRLIASGELKNCSLTVLGRWPKEIQWKSANTVGPKHGPELASILREHDLYVTASRWEPGGMHFIEGMQCGLPVIYHPDGGGIVEIASKAGISMDMGLKEAVIEAMDKYEVLRTDCMQYMPNGKRMSDAYWKYLELG